jgi:ParB family chromosome partitioning protein
LSRDKVAKYVRLATLESALLARVDSGEISFLAAYDLSFIADKNKQSAIADVLENGCKIDMKIAALLREYHERGKLNDTTIAQILSGEKTRKPRSNQAKAFALKPAVIGKYFTAKQTKDEIAEIIDAALSQYFAQK